MIAGHVVFDGIQKLLKDAAPNLELLMRWFGINQKIMQRNNVLNEAGVDYMDKFLILSKDRLHPVGQRG